MVKQAVGAIGGIAEMKISISSEDDAIAIVVNVSIVAGTHVPTVTLNIQRAIRQFVEMNCGVAVRSVAVNVQSVTTPGEGRKGRKAEIPAAQPWSPAPEAPVAQPEPAYEPAAQPEPVYAPEAPAEEIPAAEEAPAENAEEPVNPAE